MLIRIDGWDISVFIFLQVYECRHFDELFGIEELKNSFILRHTIYSGFLANHRDSSITKDMEKFLNRKIFHACTFKKEEKYKIFWMGCCWSEKGWRSSVWVFVGIGDCGFAPPNILVRNYKVISPYLGKIYFLID